MVRVTAYAVLGFFAGMADATGAPANACVGLLSPQAKLIYDATLPDLKPGISLHDSLHDHTRALVIRGLVPREHAHDLAVEAGKCLYVTRN